MLIVEQEHLRTQGWRLLPSLVWQYLSCDLNYMEEELNCTLNLAKTSLRDVALPSLVSKKGSYFKHTGFPQGLGSFYIWAVFPPVEGQALAQDCYQSSGDTSLNLKLARLIKPRPILVQCFVSHSGQSDVSERLTGRIFPSCVIIPLQLSLKAQHLVYYYEWWFGNQNSLFPECSSPGYEAFFYKYFTALEDLSLCWVVPCPQWFCFFCQIIGSRSHSEMN